MLSPADLFVAFVAGLLLFGPEGLPQVARKAGKAMRELQDASHSFLREMERAADFSESEPAERRPSEPALGHPPPEAPHEEESGHPSEGSRSSGEPRS